MQSLPPSRSSLASYGLEYGGALRIRVSDFSNDLIKVFLLIDALGVAGVGIYRGERQS